MDDMKAMMQEELRQALAGLMPPQAPTAANLPTLIAAAAPVAANPLADAVAPTAVPPAANRPTVDAPPANNDNAGGNL